LVSYFSQTTTQSFHLSICLATFSKLCPECWDPDQPQLQLGMYPVDDPQAVREPRPDVSYQASGTSGLQILLTDSNAPNGFGYPEGGSRVFQWGWNPVGGASQFDAALTPNYLVLNVEIVSAPIVINPVAGKLAVVLRVIVVSVDSIAVATTASDR